MSVKTNNNYLLIPSVPTPNGRLHLGHAGGPYLTCDVLARHLRSSGHQAVVITGTDSYESFVMKQAEKENLSPAEICHRYHALIADDLKIMDIEVNEFINPLAPAWTDVYRSWHERILQRLCTKGFTQEIKERIPWDESQQRFLTGCWLQGICPLCQLSIVGYFCENCGAHFRPEEVGNELDLPMQTVKNIFLNLPVMKAFEHEALNKNLRKIYATYLQQQNHLLRLSTHCEWGLSLNHHSTLFTYGFLFAYFLMLGEKAGQLFKINKNAFAHDSDVINIASFGIDNSIPILGSALGITSVVEEYRPFDHYIVNYFYYLDGKKFSTSQHHAIWVADICHGKISSDIVRLYLASIDVRENIGNFVVADFIIFYNKTINWIERYILKTLPMLLKTSGVDAVIHTQFQNLFTEYNKFLQPNHFYPHAAIKLIDKWLAYANIFTLNNENKFWWLKGLSIFIYPFMPKLAVMLWQALGYHGVPINYDFRALPVISARKHLAMTFLSLNQDWKPGGNHDFSQ